MSSVVTGTCDRFVSSINLSFPLDHPVNHNLFGMNGHSISGIADKEIPFEHFALSRMTLNRYGNRR